jgi:hypothetical protein
MFDVSHLQNVQPTATIKIAEISTSKRQSPKSSDSFRAVGLLARVAVNGDAATFGLLGEP